MFVNCQSEVSKRDDVDIQNLSYMLEQNPWIKSMAEKNKNFKKQLEEDNMESFMSNRASAHFSDPRFSHHYLTTTQEQITAE